MTLRIWEVGFDNPRGRYFGERYNDIQVAAPNALQAIIFARKKMKDIRYCGIHDVRSVKLMGEVFG